MNGDKNIKFTKVDKKRLEKEKNKKRYKKEFIL